MDLSGLLGNPLVWILIIVIAVISARRRHSIRHLREEDERQKYELSIERTKRARRELEDKK